MTTDTEINLQGVTGDAEAAARGIEYGRELMEFAEAFARRDTDQLEECRHRLEQVAGSAVLVDAAGVAANFQRMVRIADSIGIPVDDMTSDLGVQIRSELDLEQFASAQNTLQAGGN